MSFKIKIIEISDDLKLKSNHDFDFKIMILILKSKSSPSLTVCNSKETSYTELLFSESYTSLKQ